MSTHRNSSLIENADIEIRYKVDGKEIFIKAKGVQISVNVEIERAEYYDGSFATKIDQIELKQPLTIVTAISDKWDWK